MPYTGNMILYGTERPASEGKKGYEPSNDMRLYWKGAKAQTRAESGENL